MNKAKHPTEKDLQVLSAIKAYRVEQGLMPTRMDLCRYTNLSTGTVWGSLARLQRFNLATWTKGAARSIRLVQEAPSA